MLEQRLCSLLHISSRRRQALLYLWLSRLVCLQMWRGFSSGPSAVVLDFGQDQPHLAAGLPLLSHSDAHISLPPVFPLHEVRDRSPTVSFAPLTEGFMHMLVCV